MSRGKIIRIRVSEYEYQQIKEEADRQGISMSDLLRKYGASLPAPQGARTTSHP